MVWESAVELKRNRDKKMAFLACSNYWVSRQSKTSRPNSCLPPRGKARGLVVSYRAVDSASRPEKATAGGLREALKSAQNSEADGGLREALRSAQNREAHGGSREALKPSPERLVGGLRGARKSDDETFR